MWLGLPRKGSNVEKTKTSDWLCPQLKCLGGKWRQRSIKYSTSDNSFHFGASYLSLPDRTVWKEWISKRVWKTSEMRSPHCPFSYTDKKKAVWAFRGIESQWEEIKRPSEKSHWTRSRWHCLGLAVEKWCSLVPAENTAPNLQAADRARMWVTSIAVCTQGWKLCLWRSHFRLTSLQRRANFIIRALVSFRLINTLWAFYCSMVFFFPFITNALFQWGMSHVDGSSQRP